MSLQYDRFSETRTKFFFAGLEGKYLLMFGLYLEIMFLGLLHFTLCIFSLKKINVLIGPNPTCFLSFIISTFLDFTTT